MTAILSEKDQEKAHVEFARAVKRNVLNKFIPEWTKYAPTACPHNRGPADFIEYAAKAILGKPVAEKFQELLIESEHVSRDLLITDIEAFINELIPA